MKSLVALSLCMAFVSCTTATKQANLNTPKRELAQDRIPLNDKQLSEAFEAARTGQYEVLRNFHNKGYNANTPSKDGYTPAHLAAAMGQLKVYNFLKNHGYNVYTPDKTGDTPQDLFRIFNKGQPCY